MRESMDRFAFRAISLLLVFCGSLNAAAAKKPPNIILIMADNKCDATPC